jgi:hypothetical protein
VLSRTVFVESVAAWEDRGINVWNTYIWPRVCENYLDFIDIGMVLYK